MENIKLMNKPTILILCDVKGWAWDIKSHYIKKYLEPYYDIEIAYGCNANFKLKKEYDLYFSYGYAFTKQILNGKNKDKSITGVTAHKKWSMIIDAMNKTKYHHANSILLYDELRLKGFNPFYVPNGVDIEKFYSIKPLYHQRSHLSIGHIGRKTGNKNQTSFIEPIMKSLRIDYKPHYNHYKNAIPHSEMIHKYQNFDIFIAASDEDGTPNGMLEAGACGRSVIINKIGNAPELIKNGVNGFIVPMNPEAYIEVIRWCQNNSESVMKMGKKLQEDIRTKWTWELMSRNYLLMFDNILSIKRNRELYENPALYHIDDYYMRF